MKKRAVIGTSIVLLAIAAIGFVIYMVFYHESNTPDTSDTDVEERVNDVVALTPYGQSLSELVTYNQWNATWEKIQNSDAAYLQDPDFDVTADNFQQCLYDFLAAPARLYYGSTDDSENSAYKCDSPEIRLKFADAFQDVSLTECSEEEYDALAGTEYNTQIGFYTLMGTIYILCYHDYSCISFGRYHMQTNSYTSDCFYVGENLHDKLMTAYEKVLPYSMEAPMEETE